MENEEKPEQKLETIREQVTAKYLGRMKEGARWVYQFLNPRNAEDKPMRIAAFPPRDDDNPKVELPALSEEKYYTFSIDHVPEVDKATKKQTGKRHHNFARNGYNGPYLIEPAQKSLEDGIKTGYDIAKEQAKKQPTPTKVPEAQPPRAPFVDYKAERDKVEIAQKPIIIRESCLSSAATSLQMNASPMKTPDDIAMDVIKVAKAYEIFCLNGSILEAKEWLKEQRIAQKQIEGVEANP